MTVFQNKHGYGAWKKKSTSKESAPRRDMIWFSGVEETNQGSEAKYNSPAKAMAQKAMNMRTFEEVEHSGHLTMQNFNRKSEALAAS